jgi:hypothetical protein
VALDLSLPAMPGAFMFDAAGSVESVDAVGGRSTETITVLATPIRDEFVPSQPRSDVGQRPPLNIQVAAPGWARANCLPRANCAPSRPSKDPH